MRLRGARPALLAVAVISAVMIGVFVTPPARSATTVPHPIAPFGQTSAIGALFTLASSGQLQSHFCTASVVDSPAGDLLVTAAHCMQGQTAGQVAFVPDYSSGQEPYGVWTVTQVIVDKNWTTSDDPDDDFAFLVVSRANSKVPVQEITGGEALGIGASAGRTVEVAGYPDSQDALLSCENTVLAYSGTQFEFDCAGFTDGTSGSPLLADGIPVGPAPKAARAGADVVIGVIGGYEQGGYTASVSYAARFSSRLSALYEVALTAAGQ